MTIEYSNNFKRKYTSDIVRKRDRNVIFNEFYTQYIKLMTQRAKALCRRTQVAPFVYEDCVQAAMMRVYQSIPTWNPIKGNLYTYTFLGARKAMICIVREYHANRPYGTNRLIHFIASESDTDWKGDKDLRKGDTYLSPMQHEDKLHDAIYIKRVIDDATQNDPKRVHRFITYALDGATVSQLARECTGNVSKQVYSNGITHVRKQLRKKARVHYG